MPTDRERCPSSDRNMGKLIPFGELEGRRSKKEKAARIEVIRREIAELKEEARNLAETGYSKTSIDRHESAHHFRLKKLDSIRQLERELQELLTEQ